MNAAASLPRLPWGQFRALTLSCLPSRGPRALALSCLSHRRSLTACCSNQIAENSFSFDPSFHDGISSTIWTKSRSSGAIGGRRDFLTSSSIRAIPSKRGLTSTLRFDGRVAAAPSWAIGETGVPALFRPLRGVSLSFRRRVGDYRPSVAGKRVLVTGASRGIGRHVALHYARLGARLVLTARDEASLVGVAEECRRLGAASSSSSSSVDYVVGAQGTPEEALSLVEKATASLGGGLDVLFLNHGLSAQSAWKGTKEQFDAADRAMRVNYFSQMYLASAALPTLKEGAGGGSIVVVNSASARSAMPAFSYYGASKAAMATFFRSLNLELQLSKVDVTVTVCTLGLVKTERNIGKETSSLAFRLGAEPEDAAEFMIKSAALKKPEVKYPLIQFLMKDVMDSLPPKLRRIVMKRVVPQSH